MEGPGRRKGILVEDGGVLSIKGFILQTILILGQPDDRGIKDAPNLSHLLNMLSDMVTCQNRMSTYRTGENLILSWTVSLKLISQGTGKILRLFGTATLLQIFCWELSCKVSRRPKR